MRGRFIVWVLVGVVIMYNRGEVVKIDLCKIYCFMLLDYVFGVLLFSGGDIYYECIICNGVISLVLCIVLVCECGNFIGNGGQVVIKEIDKVNLVCGKFK